MPPSPMRRVRYAPHLRRSSPRRSVTRFISPCSSGPRSIAARIASAAGVSLLALTHFSPRYFGPELLRQAREVFPATVAPRDFDLIEVPFRERGTPTLVKGGASPERGQREALAP